MLVSASRNAAFIFLACLMTYLAGKDVNWDLLNYHLYIAHAWEHTKYLTDFMGAGPNSYFNPLGYLPFYWMVMAGWHSLAIGLLMGAFHGLGLIILWAICEQFLFRGQAHARLLSTVSVLLAASSPVFAGVVGGTFLEPTLTVFVFASLWLTGLGCERGAPGKSLLLILGGGLLMGLATGLKLTNIVFVTAMGLSLLFVMGMRFKALVTPTVFSIGVIVGYLMVNGWWAYQLYQEFGNPFFPFFNEIFQSPDFSAAKLDHDRFKLASPLDVLTLPFRMAYFHSWIYVENNAPDIRPALLVVFGVALAAKTLIAKARENGSVTIRKNPARNMVFAFFACSTALWLWTTGNGRYALPILMLVGPLLTLTIYKTTANVKHTSILVSAVLVLQLLHAGSAGNPRWTSTEWTPLWFKSTMPSRLKDNPHAYLSLGTSRSNSVVAPFLHPKSTFVSLTGGTYAFRPDGPGSERIHEVIKLHKNHLRMLVTIPPGRRPSENGAFNILDMSLAPWALKIIRSDCEFLDVALAPDNDLPETLSKRLQDKSSNIPLLSCALETSEGEDEETLLERRRLTLVFDRMEKNCPLLFSPRGWHLTKQVTGWQRTYLQSDIVVYARKGRLSLSKYNFGPFDVDMGSIEEWENNRSKFVCERLLRPW